jgi:hypothetical protein
MTAIERIFILDGGLAKVRDGSIYSPGVNVGVPMTLICNAYLIRQDIVRFSYVYRKSANSISASRVAVATSRR